MAEAIAAIAGREDGSTPCALVQYYSSSLSELSDAKFQALIRLQLFLLNSQTILDFIFRGSTILLAISIYANRESRAGISKILGGICLMKGTSKLKKIHEQYHRLWAGCQDWQPAKYQNDDAVLKRPRIFGEENKSLIGMIKNLGKHKLHKVYNRTTEDQ